MKENKTSDKVVRVKRNKLRVNATSSSSSAVEEHDDSQRDDMIVMTTALASSQSSQKSSLEEILESKKEALNNLCRLAYVLNSLYPFSNQKFIAKVVGQAGRDEEGELDN